MISPEFRCFYAKTRSAVTNTLAEALHAVDSPTQLRSAMHYACTDGGKLLRPTCVLAAALDSGGVMEEALPLAAAVELIHAYSLVHDDLPAMDNDDFRRGKPSCHRQYGEAMAILTGNSLLSLAFELALSGENAERATQAVLLLAGASGAGGICGGQAMDLGLEGRPTSAEEVLHCYRLKTGALFAACAMAGAVLVCGHTAPLDALQRFGLDFGQAFQIYDDLGEKENESDTLLTFVDRRSARQLAQVSMQKAREQIPAEYALLKELTLYVEELSSSD